MPEYYIRQPDAEETRGPFDLDRIQSLAEAGQVDEETLFYDDAAQAWRKIVDVEELKAAVFPERAKVTLRKKDRSELKLLNKDDDAGPAVSVDEFLAAAEGATKDTKHTKEKQKWQERAAALAVPGLGVAMLLQALVHIFPNLDLIKRISEDYDYLLLLREPLLLLGIFDLFLAICLFLAVTEVFTLLRLRATAGLGYFGFFYWSLWQNGDPSGLGLLCAAMATGIGVFMGTLTLNFVVMVISLTLAIGGAAAYGIFTIL